MRKAILIDDRKEGNEISDGPRSRVKTGFKDLRQNLRDSCRTIFKRIRAVIFNCDRFDICALSSFNTEK